MWNVKLVDIGGNGLITEINSNLETLAEVELCAKQTINEHLGISCTMLEHVEDLVYSVWINGHEIGVVVIKDVNPAPVERK